MNGARTLVRILLQNKSFIYANLNQIIITSCRIIRCLDVSELKLSKIERGGVMHHPSSTS
jgi:hypothetical protein